MLVVSGNCQSRGLALMLDLLLPDETITSRPVSASFSDLGADDVVILQQPFVEQCSQSIPEQTQRLIWPSVTFSGLHPDIVHCPGVPAPVGGWHSSIMLTAYLQNLSESQTLSLFRAEVFEKLGFHDLYDTGIRALHRWLTDIGYPADALISGWVASGNFMHGINHPKETVTLDVARQVMLQLGRGWDDRVLTRFSLDTLRWSGSWPVYPEVSRRLGLGPGDYYFKTESQSPTSLGRVYDLPEMIAASFEIYEKTPREKLIHQRLKQQPYATLKDLVSAKPAQGQAQRSPSPYVGIPDHQFWKRGVSLIAKGEVDPVVTAKFPIAQSDRVATAGSCFAQHIARTLVRSGFNYYVPEGAPAGLSAADAEARQFGLFSARFGNLYTVRQLVQLFDRAFGRFQPEETAWPTADGRYVDPFRPTVEPGGFATIEELEADRRRHFAAVREMFESLSVFVFTLGLTEGWRSRIDGAVYPLAPGVSGGEFDPARHEFVNFTVEEVKADLEAIWTRLRSVNAKAKMILTVSPVPLIATYEPRHVLVSTCYSKAVLRAAVDEIARREPDVAYFPSYEVITGNHAGNSYFEQDLRSVREEGVAHVMSLFLGHYTGRWPGAAAVATGPISAALGSATIAAGASPASALADAEAEINARVICDEEQIVRF